MTLLDDQLCLELTDDVLEHAQASARDFRSVTSTVVIGLPLHILHGGIAVRSIQSIHGIRSVILDARLFGTPAELWRGIQAAASLQITAVTVCTFSGPAAIKAANEAAIVIQKRQSLPKKIGIFGTLLPPCEHFRNTANAVDIHQSRGDYVLQMTRMLQECGADAVVVDYNDIRGIRRHFKRFPVLSRARCPIRVSDFQLVAEKPQDPGWGNAIAAGASHVFFSPSLVNLYDVDTVSSLLRKLLDLQVKESKQKKHLLP